MRFDKETNKFVVYEIYDSAEPIFSSVDIFCLPSEVESRAADLSEYVTIIARQILPPRRPPIDTSTPDPQSLDTEAIDLATHGLRGIMSIASPPNLYQMSLPDVFEVTVSYTGGEVAINPHSASPMPNKYNICSNCWREIGKDVSDEIKLFIRHDHSGPAFILTGKPEGSQIKYYCYHQNASQFLRDLSTLVTVNDYKMTKYIRND
jgi:hypothetical protein